MADKNVDALADRFHEQVKFVPIGRTGFLKIRLSILYPYYS